MYKSESHHVSPGLDLPLPVPQGGQGRNDDVRAQHPQELLLEGQRGDRLRGLAQALQPSLDSVEGLLRVCLRMRASTTCCRPMTLSHCVHPG